MFKNTLPKIHLKSGKKVDRSLRSKGCSGSFFLCRRGGIKAFFQHIHQVLYRS